MTSPEIYPAFSSGIGLTTEKPLPCALVVVFCTISDPSVVTIFSEAFDRVNLCNMSRYKFCECNEWSLWRTNNMSFLRFSEMVCREQELKARVTLKLRLTEKSGAVVLLVFQILLERSIIMSLKSLAVGQVKVQLIIK